LFITNGRLRDDVGAETLLCAVNPVVLALRDTTGCFRTATGFSADESPAGSTTFLRSPARLACAAPLRSPAPT
jgi:hypothetical protein